MILVCLRSKCSVRFSLLTRLAFAPFHVSLSLIVSVFVLVIFLPVMDYLFGLVCSNLGQRCELLLGRGSDWSEGVLVSGWRVNNAVTLVLRRATSSVSLDVGLRIAYHVTGDRGL